MKRAKQRCPRHSWHKPLSVYPVRRKTSSNSDWLRSNLQAEPAGLGGDIRRESRRLSFGRFRFPPIDQFAKRRKPCLKRRGFQSLSTSVEPLMSI